MRRIPRLYLGIVFICGCVILWGAMYHSRTFPDEESAQLPYANVNNIDSNVERLQQKLEAIQSQMDDQIQEYRHLLKGIKENGGNLTNVKENSGKGDVNSEKLNNLHRELQQEAHLGEVQSGLVGDGAENVEVKHPKHDYDENGAHEVIEEDLHDRSRESVIAILVLVCNRPSVTRCLDRLLKYRPSESQFPIILSQDCGKHQKTMDAINPYENQITHVFQPNLETIQVSNGHQAFVGYYKISRHYRWALNEVFNDQRNFTHVIIVEDDIEISPDFFEYFQATVPIVAKDPSIWCVSAWNDNGKTQRISTNHPELLYRSDFFPGLGWMIKREIWNELANKWPAAFWDDWMREPNQRKERVCIRPEISRTSTFGKVGVSRGTYYETHLQYIKLSDVFIPFTKMDLTYLTKENYDKNFLTRVNDAEEVSSLPELTEKVKNAQPDDEYRLIYSSNVEFKRFALKLDIMDDFKAGVPRTAYLGIVPIMYANHRVFLVPLQPWDGYKS